MKIKKKGMRPKPQTVVSTLKERYPGLVINRLRWDSQYDISKASFVYTHRGDPNDEKELPLTAVSGVGGLFVYLTDEYEDHLLPLHRIVRIKYDGKIIWKRSQKDNWERAP